MANYNEFKQIVNTNLPTNAAGLITAARLRDTLTSLADILKGGWLFAGMAQPQATASATLALPDAPVFYLANTAGTYAQFRAEEPYVLTKTWGLFYSKQGMWEMKLLTGLPIGTPVTTDELLASVRTIVTTDNQIEAFLTTFIRAMVDADSQIKAELRSLLLTETIRPDDRTHAVVASAIKAYIDKADKALRADLDDCQIKVGSLNTKVGELETKSDNYEDRLKTLEFEINRDFFVAGYAKDSTDAKPVKEYGNKAILKEFYPYLVDTRTTDADGNPIEAISEDGTKIKPVGQLMKNNLLRFIDGEWAPTVGITQAMYDECMTNKLYLDEQGEEVYCDVGGYDAEKYFEEIREQLVENPMVENPKKLYKKSRENYVEVSHYLKPYETVDAHYSIVMGAEHKLYVLDDVEGETEGIVWKGIFLNDTIWDGIDVSEFSLAPTGIAMCPVTVVTEDGVQKSKCFFYNYKAGGTQNAGMGSTNMFVKDRTYPKTEDMTQLTNVTRARNCNPDKTKPYPFAEGGFLARTNFINATELRVGTRDLGNAGLFGSGISSNDGCTSEATFYKYGGLRYSDDGGSSYKYVDWGTTLPIYYGNAGSRKTTNASDFVNGHRPKEECMESQIAVSYAAELGIKPAETDGHNNNFMFYGGTYWYRDVANDNCTGLLAGGMDVQVYRTIQVDYEGYASASATEKTAFKLEACLRMSLYDGVNLSGDFFDCCGGGIEMIGYVTDSNKAAGSYGVDVKVYVEHDQRKWVNDTNIIIDDSKDFDAETHYKYIGETTTTTNGYSKRRLSNAPIKVTNASTIHQGVCGYVLNQNYFCNTANKKARLGVRFRGFANHSSCSARSLNANISVSYTYSAYGGSAQVLLDFGAE